MLLDTIWLGKYFFCKTMKKQCFVCKCYTDNGAEIMEHMTTVLQYMFRVFDLYTSNFYCSTFRTLLNFRHIHGPCFQMQARFISICNVTYSSTL